MAKFIAYEWDDQSVRAISASPKGSDIVLHALVEKPRETATDDRTDEQILEDTVSAALESVGVSRGQATAFSARRSQAEVRMLTFPNVPAHDLPDMVRLQAPQVFNAGTEGLLDFTQIGELQDGQQYIAAAALSNVMKIETISTASQAGVTISNMALHPFGSSSYIQKHLPSDDARLIIDILGVEAELTVARKGIAHLVRTIRLIPDAPDLDYITLEAGRTLTSYENQPNGGDIQQIVISGTSEMHETLLGKLEPLVTEPVILFDPFKSVALDASVKKAMPESASSFLGLIGLAEQLACGDVPPIDFLNPTQPPKQTAKRDKAVRASVYAGLAVAVLSVALWLPVANLKQQIADEQPVAELQKAVADKYDKAENQLTSIQTYDSSSVNWLDELALLSDTLPPDPNDVIVDAFSGRSDNSRDRTNETPLGLIFLDMHLKNSGVFERLSTTLDGGSHLVESKGLTPDTTEDGLYTRRTQQTITILPAIDDVETDETDSEATSPESTETEEGSVSTNPKETAEGNATGAEQTNVTKERDGE